MMQSEVCSDLIREMPNNVLLKLITEDEMWCFQYDIEGKWQSMQRQTPASPRPKKAHMMKSQMKRTFIIFFDSRSIISLQIHPTWLNSQPTLFCKNTNEVT
jgi:hypothetical protein